MRFITVLLFSILAAFALIPSAFWPALKALSLVVVFLAFDLAFLVTNLVKFFSGGYVPVLIDGKG
jgi:K+ transporter